MDIFSKARDEAEKKRHEVELRAKSLEDQLRARVTERAGIVWKHHTVGVWEVTTLEGHSGSVHFQFKPERTSRGSFRGSRPTGKIRAYIGPYGEMRQFPEPKNGFDLDKLATVIIEDIENSVAGRQRMQRVDAAHSIAKPAVLRLRDEFPEEKWNINESHFSDATPAIKLRLRDEEWTEDEARQILSMFRSIKSRRMANVKEDK